MTGALSLWRGEIRSGRPRMREIAEATARAQGFTLAQIKTPDRSQALAYCRQDIMLALREAGHWSTPQIGRLLNRHHATVIYGARRANLRRLRAQREAA